MGKYAMLLSGGVDKSNNYIRYRNDLEWAYKVLVDDCGYQKDNILVYYADGTDIEYGAERIFTAPAEKDSILQNLEEWISTLSAWDELTVVVSNHGGSDKDGFINLWGTECIELGLFARILNQIRARKTIILGECYAGNILRHDIENGCVLTANQEGCPSYVNPYKDGYDEFILHFFSYIHGAYPDGSELKEQGGNDVRKAYQYAVDNDVFHPDGSLGKTLYLVTGKRYVEIPQMKCNIEGMIEL